MLQGNKRFTAILGCANRFGTKWDKEEALLCEKGLDTTYFSWYEWS
jgi:hypothetical protein